MTLDIFELQRRLSSAFQEALASLGAADCPLLLERPKDPSHGDFATPLAMTLAKRLKRPPLEVAKTLLEHFRPDPSLLLSAEAVAPGFINLRLNPKILFEILSCALSQGQAYGRNEQGKGRKILMEFVSANPTGPLNVVNARAAALGDSIANLLSSSGTEVLREYYVNDAGVQARLFGESLLAACDRLEGKDHPAPEGGYQGSYMEDLAAEYRKLSPRPEPGPWGMQQVVQWHKDALERYGVRFDRWFSERSALHEAGLVAKTIEDLKKSGLTYEKEGAVWIKVSEFGAPKDEVLLKSDGNPAYFAADIAYHLHKFDRGFDELLDIWGPDHHGHIQRMKSALSAAKAPADRLTVLIAQQVNLLSGGEKVKMSKREGKFVTMDELLGDVGRDAARYFFVMRGANTHLDFDLEVARKQTDENPVYYVQYAHARICSLLRKCSEKGLHPATAASDFTALAEPEAFLLLKEIMEYPQWVLESGKAYEPHRIVAFLQALAADFHLFYAKHRILDADPAAARARLGLATGVKMVLHNALGLLGVSAPEQM